MALVRRGARRAVCLVVVLLTMVTAAPAARAARPMLVADIGSLSGDEQLMFGVLQGLVNRNGPQIYLEGFRDGQDFQIDRTASKWLHDAVPLPTRRVRPYDLLTRFRRSVRGLVVWDPALRTDSQNVATTIAGVRNLLPVSPALAARLGRAPYRYRISTDLRGRFANRSDAYHWALSNLRPKAGFGLLAWLGDPRNGLPGQHGMRDWIVAHRGFAFDANTQSETSLVSDIFNGVPEARIVFGYPFFDDPWYQPTGEATGEPIGVGEISRAGKVLIPTTDATNLTVHSWFRAKWRTPPWDDHPRTPKAKTYVSFVITDGDNLGYNEQGLRVLHWDDRARGSIPMGISLSLYLPVYAPKLYAYYVRTLAKSDVVVAGPSGAGYAYPSSLPNLDDYLARTRELMKLSGLRSVWILDNGYLWSPPPMTTQKYVSALHPRVVFTDYGGYVVPNPPAVTSQDGVPVIHAMWGPDVGQTVGKIQLAAATSGPAPVFVLVALSTWGMSYTQAKDVMRQLGPGYEAVRPDTFVGLIKGAGQTQL